MDSRLNSEFARLAGYLAGEGSIPDAEKYRDDLPARLAFARRLKAYAALAGEGRGKTILDIGCSLGHGTRLLAEGARAVAGLDAGERPLQEASRQKAGGRIIYTRGDARLLPFPDGTFDLVAAFHLIEHLKPDVLSALLRETRRVAADNGTVCFVTPNRRFRLRPFQPPFNPEHLREYTARGLRRELAPVFSDIRIFGLRGRPWIEAIERARVRRSPFRVYLVDPLARCRPG